MYRGMFGGGGGGGSGSSIQSLLTQLQNITNKDSATFDPFMESAHVQLDLLSQICEKLSFVQNGETRSSNTNPAQRRAEDRVPLSPSPLVAHSQICRAYLCLLLEGELSGLRVSELCRTLVTLLPDQSDTPDIMRQSNGNATRRSKVGQRGSSATSERHG